MKNFFNANPILGSILAFFAIGFLLGVAIGINLFLKN